MKIRTVEIALMGALALGAAPFFAVSSSADGAAVKAVSETPPVVEARTEALPSAPACERKVKVVYGSEAGKTVCAPPRG